MHTPDYAPKRLNNEPAPPGGQARSRPRWSAPLLAAAVAVCLTLLVGPGVSQAQYDEPLAEPAVMALPELPVVTPPPVPTPTPEPAPEPYDFSRAAAESEPVEMAWFDDAVFLGDSRTDGLRLYSGIRGPDFLCYKGITVFDVMDRPDKRVITLDGEKYTILEALAARQYAKVYISLGVNELGYNDDESFEAEYKALLETVRSLQPDAVIYLQNLTPVNPDKCREYNQPAYVTNRQVAAYNEIFARLARSERVVLVDVASALVDEEGILPREGTVDGVHFSKDWYEKWLAYLMCHTADPEAYFAGQAGTEGEEPV